MSYPHDKGYNFSHTKSLGWKKPAGIVFVVLALYLWGSSVLVDATSFIVYPYLKMFGQIDQNFSDALRNKKNLLAENEKLRIINAKLQAESLRLNNLQTENNQLRSLDVETVISPNPILGRVIVKPNHLPYDEIVIDVGKTQYSSVKSGQLVFADNDVVLGQIESIASNYSKVKLYSTGGVKIPVVVGESSIPSIAEGLGAGNFSLTLPRGVDVKVGDRVKTSIVGNYVLGYVGNIIKDSNDPFQKIMFRSPYNVFELDWVQLLHD